ncbi:amino acid--tRNA ligase-related protein [Granulicella sp. L46]|uniref:lysine--tRNA ligase n=1 Tax=Granulicella sp. L46 TaxID=1641865 RepID=UPI00131BC1AC|nr:lysine--tRNA ligase [Granulicella sp. L46]
MPQYDSQFEENLYQLRREKLDQIAALARAANPSLSDYEAKYPNCFLSTASVPELRALGENLSAEDLERMHIEAAVAGRIMAIRVQGKAGFAQIQQHGQRLQIYVRKDDVGEDLFNLYKLLDLGDHIGVRGYLMRTRTGELTLHAAPIKLEHHESKPAITFLSKAMLALPDKYHGLEDIEIRYRQRYADLFTNPEVREVFVKRAHILRSVRHYFDTHGYLEVETPMLHTIAGGATARTFTTHHNAEDMELTLRIAPELHLKRLVVGGLDRVYEINRNFRNEGIDRTHNPEFTMLEFYQAYANYHDLMALTQDLIINVAKEVNGTTITHFNGNEIDLSKWTRLSMREAILKWWPEEAHVPTDGIFTDLSLAMPAIFSLYMYYNSPTQDEDDVLTSQAPEERKEAANKAAALWPAYKQAEPIYMQALEDPAGTKELACAALGKLIAGVFEALAEEHLIQPTIIYDFPLAVSPLSKIKPDEPDWVERFEFYIGGFELGNAFSELNDPDDQLRRFQSQLDDRKRGDIEAMAEVDYDYVRALGYGLPPTAGEGIGIDRLTMILTGSRTIRDVIIFPLMRPQRPSSEPNPNHPHGESAE